MLKLKALVWGIMLFKANAMRLGFFKYAVGYGGRSLLLSSDTTMKLGKKRTQLWPCS